MDSQITLFLKGKGKDTKGRMINQIRALPDHRLENSHDVIQWLFPTDLPSQHQEQSPVLTYSDIEIIKSDSKIQDNLQLSLDRMIRFYEKNDYWITQKNHNFLRITRILRCLWLAGRIHDYVCFQRVLDDIYIDYNDIIGDSFYFWKCANDKDFLLNPQKYIPTIYNAKKSKGESAAEEVSTPYDEDEPNLFDYR